MELDVEQHHNTDYPRYDWQVSTETVRRWTKKVLEEGMPGHTDILNINIPRGAEDPDDYRITRLANYQLPP